MTELLARRWQISCSRQMQWAPGRCYVHSPDGSTLPREMTSWLPSWKYDVNPTVSISGYRTILQKFQPDPVWNDGALGIFGQRCLNKKTTRWVAIWVPDPITVKSRCFWNTKWLYIHYDIYVLWLSPDFMTLWQHSCIHWHYTMNMHVFPYSTEHLSAYTNVNKNDAVPNYACIIYTKFIAVCNIDLSHTDFDASFVLICFIIILMLSVFVMNKYVSS